jgi:hypothetical protein
MVGDLLLETKKIIFVNTFTFGQTMQSLYLQCKR